MMRRRIISALLLCALLAPELVRAQSVPRQQLASSNSPPAAAPAAQTDKSPTAPKNLRPQPAARRRSYERETRTRRHPRISKQEVAFMVAIAGTSMGIGALAGGAKGLVIGSIVGGWGAYAGHRLWHWIK